MNLPAVPYAFDFLVSGRILLKRIDIVANLERHNIPMHKMLVSRGVRPCGDVSATRKLGISAVDWGERMDRVSVDDEGEGFPDSFPLSEGADHGDRAADPP